MDELYQHLYLLLFNGITDALEALGKGQCEQAQTILIRAQQAAEEAYISTPDGKVIPFPNHMDK